MATRDWPRDQGRQPFDSIAFVGPPVTTNPDRVLNECEVFDFVCRREFDFSVVEYANGKPLNEILGISYKKDGRSSTIPIVRKWKTWMRCHGRRRSTNATWM